MSSDDVFSRGSQVVPFAAVSPLGKPRGRSLKPPMVGGRKTMNEDPDEIRRRKDAFVASSDLVKAVEQRKDTTEMLQHIKLELAKEAANLQFFQTEEEGKGEDSSSLSLRRIKALKEIVNIEANITKLGGSILLDLKSEKFQKVHAYWILMVREVAVEILTPEQLDLFANRLETRMENWEERAQGHNTGQNG